MHDDAYWADVAGLAWRYFDLGASIIWATTGALRAAKHRYDLTGLFAIALVSSTGGGLLRDGLFLQAGPPALVRTPIYIAIAGVAAMLVWAFAHRTEAWSLLDRVASVADGFGLGGFAIAGMQLSAALDVNVVGALLVGVVNAVGGGILGSLLMREVPEVFRPGHLMALAVLPGCVLYETLTVGFGVGFNLAAVPTLVLVALLRWFSIRYSFRTSAPRRLRARGRRCASERELVGDCACGDDCRPDCVGTLGEDPLEQVGCSACFSEISARSGSHERTRLDCVRRTVSGLGVALFSHQGCTC